MKHGEIERYVLDDNKTGLLGCTPSPEDGTLSCHFVTKTFDKECLITGFQEVRTRLLPTVAAATAMKFVILHRLLTMPTMVTRMVMVLPAHGMHLITAMIPRQS